MECSGYSDEQPRNKAISGQIEIQPSSYVHLPPCIIYNRHSKVLYEGLSDIRQWSPITTNGVIDKESLRILDQIAYRFTKLQDSMGVKLLPLILVLAQEPISENVTFTEKLNRLERIGYR